MPFRPGGDLGHYVIYVRIVFFFFFFFFINGELRPKLESIEIWI